MNDLPNPGSNEAVDAGCTCPVIDNHYGAGIERKGRITFWYTEGCPVHQNSLPIEEEEI